jgi:hypothetical protein
VLSTGWSAVSNVPLCCKDLTRKKNAVTIQAFPVEQLRGQALLIALAAPNQWTRVQILDWYGVGQRVSSRATNALRVIVCGLWQSRLAYQVQKKGPGQGCVT